MKTILVTGGSGFIGNCFCKLLLKERPDYRVLNVDIETYAANHNTIKEELNNPNYKFFQVDIRDRDLIYNIFKEEKPNIVVNFAAESHVDRSFVNQTEFYYTNVIGTSILLDACRKYGIERFHQVSTDEVYGDLDFDSLSRFDENDELNPKNPYSITKAKADKMALSYFKEYGINVTISRSCNNFGPYQFPEKFIPLIIYNAMNNLPIPIYGDGKNKREWISVQDHCRAILSIIENGIPGNIYNVGTGVEKSNNDLVLEILNIMNKSKILIQYVSDRPGHDRRYLLNCNKIENDLLWKSIDSFDDTLRTTIDWYINNIMWLNECITANKEWFK